MAPRDGSLEADFERGSASVGADRRVHIRQRGACAPKRHFHVRASAPVCGCLSYSCGTAAGAATPLRSFRPKKGATPPFGMPRSASGRAGMCTPMPPSAGGRSPPAIPSGKAIKRRCERGGSTGQSGLRASTLASQVAVQSAINRHRRSNRSVRPEAVHIARDRLALPSSKQYPSGGNWLASPGQRDGDIRLGSQHS